MMTTTKYAFLCPNDEEHGGGTVILDLMPQRQPYCNLCKAALEFMDTLEVQAPDQPQPARGRSIEAQRAQEAYLALRGAVDTKIPSNVINALVGCVSLLLERQGAELKGRS